MRYVSLFILLCSVSRVEADLAANGGNGVNARATGLTGLNVPIGQVESSRSGKAGYDDSSNSASNTIPFNVFFQTTGGQDSSDSEHIYDIQFGDAHGTAVANVMIGQSASFTGRTAVPDYAVYGGVAPNALLTSTSSGNHDEVDLVESVNRTALQFSNGVQAIKIPREIMGFQRCDR